jgi:thiol-disulfide isomerase/thioredoxin
MYVLHINSEKEVGKVNQLIKNGSDVFILVYMVGCGPCNATRPEWSKIESALKNQYSKNNKLAIVDINKDFISKVKNIGTIDGFPTIKYIGNYGKTVESYENSSITKKDRTVSSFINWIESKINKTISTTPTSSPHLVYKRLTKTEKQHKIPHYNKIPRHNKNPHNKKPHHNKTRHHKKSHKGNKKGGKWSRKYKLSINCKTPNGFSQKQYCKYGRK